MHTHREGELRKRWRREVREKRPSRVSNTAAKAKKTETESNVHCKCDETHFCWREKMMAAAG